MDTKKIAELIDRERRLQFDQQSKYMDTLFKFQYDNTLRPMSGWKIKLYSKFKFQYDNTLSF